MFYRRNSEPLPEGGIYLVLAALMVLNIFVGVTLMLLGGELWDSPSVSRFGSVLAVVSGVIYLLLRWFGVRAGRRRGRQDETPGSKQ